MAIPVNGFPDYLIDEQGRVWSNKTRKYLRPNCTEKGYESVELFNNGKSKRLLIHRLVASAYIPNPKNLPQINHKDENPHNNAVENLEWCTAKYNMNYGIGAINRHKNIDYSKPIYAINARINGMKVCVPVEMYSMNGVYIKSFRSFIEASRETGISKSNIASVANGKRKSAGGYIWKRKVG